MVQLLVIFVIALAHAQASPPAPPPVPVVVELFTSEGCSSCPPADNLLSKLAKDQPVPGALIIPLGMHVTYWDRLGWKDPASLGTATLRQHGYSRVFGEDRVYTPQAVIDGRVELVGSDERGVTRAIADAAKRPHARVTVAQEPNETRPAFAVRVDEVPVEVKEPLSVLVLLVEDGLTSVVKRGENGGRTLRHDAVVRALSPMGEHPGHLRNTYIVPDLSRDWRRDHLRVVAILQGTKSHRIWGAATVPLEQNQPGGE